jgi:[ribosomal protein S5]-alanine N-acetyltransferase
MTRAGAPVFRTARVIVRPVTSADSAQFSRLARASLDFHTPWIHAPTTSVQFLKYLSRFDDVSAQGFVIERREHHDLAGFINLNEIIRGAYQRGLLGYGAFAASAGQGYMYEALDLMIRYAFEDLGLHRLEADIQPTNLASQKLVEKAGFRNEGTSPGFILINGEWMDHQRWALTNESRPGRRERLSRPGAKRE